MPRRMKIKDARMKSKLLSAIALIVMFGCNKPSPEALAKQEAEINARKADDCRDKICEGDVEPKRDIKTEAIVKLNNQFFIGPSAYFSNGSPSTAFYWPSKTPVNTPHAEKKAPELIPSGPGRVSNFPEVAIEIFLRSNLSQTNGPSRYQALLQAEKEGRLVSKKTLNHGLEIWIVNMNDGVRDGIWYVAKEHKESDGYPPVLWCDNNNPTFDRCTTAFWWRPGIAVDMRFRATHGKDWSEIYQETKRVL